jgi:hypothetical protein
VSTLHLTDTPTTVDAHDCVHATPRSPADDPNVVVVALAGSPATWLDQWARLVDGDDADSRATFVVEEAMDWIAGHPRDRLERVAPPETDVDVETVDSAGNLTDLGVTLVDELESHRTYDAPTALCFQSLTVLLQWSETDAVFRFLHTLMGHLDDAASDGPDATAHFHIHEPAHEDDTVDRLRPLFDRVRHDRGVHREPA